MGPFQNVFAKLRLQAWHLNKTKSWVRQIFFFTDIEQLV